MSDQDRYLKAAHAMQSGVAMMMNHRAEETAPKHLRVGVNSAMVDSAALARLLIAKGVFTAEEHAAALADEMQREADGYELKISNVVGHRVTLG